MVIIDPEGKIQYEALFNNGLGKDVRHIYGAFMGLKVLHDTPEGEGHMCAIPADWTPGESPLDINIVKEVFAVKMLEVPWEYSHSAVMNLEHTIDDRYFESFAKNLWHILFLCLYYPHILLLHPCP